MRLPLDEMFGVQIMRGMVLARGGPDRPGVKGIEPDRRSRIAPEHQDEDPVTSP